MTARFSASCTAWRQWETRCSQWNATFSLTHPIPERAKCNGSQTARDATPNPQRYTPTRKTTRSGIFEFILVYAAQYSDPLCVSSPIASSFFFFSFCFVFNFFFIFHFFFFFSSSTWSTLPPKKNMVLWENARNCFTFHSLRPLARNVRRHCSTDDCFTLSVIASMGRQRWQFWKVHVSADLAGKKKKLQLWKAGLLLCFSMAEGVLGGVGFSAERCRLAWKSNHLQIVTAKWEKANRDTAI